MTSRVLVTSEQVDVSALKPHPANPRRGDVDVILKSLTAHGQYRPIVAQRSTGHILAGNHTWQAARRLKWSKIAVTWLDVDDHTAEKILLADNRTSDLASYDDAALLDLLTNLPDLEGTGFDRYDIDRLSGLFDESGGTGGTGVIGEPGGEGKTEPAAQIEVGQFRIVVDAKEFEGWCKDFAGDRKKKDIVYDLQERLGLLPPKPQAPQKAAEAPTAGVETVPINSLVPHPKNARQGDIGAISESLRHLGQYRPVVANRNTGHILVGNHTWAAASMLGWSEIAVAWVDVDEVNELKIIAADNRTSDLATYEDDLLIAMLTTMPDLDGTGFSLSDLDDLLQQVTRGGKHRRPASTSAVKCRVERWAWRVERDRWNAWERDMRPEIEGGVIEAWIADTLQLPEGSWTKEEPQP